MNTESKPSAYPAHMPADLRDYYPRALRPGIASGLHLFRDSYLRSEILISLELARALADAGIRGFHVEDLQTGATIPLNYKR